MTSLASLALRPPPSDGLFRLLWLRRGQFTLVFALVSGLALAALLTLPQTYFANGSVMVAGPEPLPGQPTDGAAAIWQQRIGDPADLDSNLLEIRAPRLLGMVVQQPEAIAAIRNECDYGAHHGLGMLIAKLKARLPEAITRYSPPEDPCAALASNNLLRIGWADHRYAVSVAGRSRVITIGYASPLPDVSVVMTNLLINTYLNDEHEKRIASRDTGISWLRQEIGRLHDSLNRDNELIQSFRRSHGLLMGRFASVTAEQLSELMGMLVRAAAGQALAAAQVHELEHGNDADLPAILESHTIEDLKRQSNDVSAQLAMLTQKYGAKSDVTAALRTQLASIESRLGAEMAHIKSSLRRTQRIHAEEVFALQNEVADLKTRAAQASDDESKIASLVRDVDVKREIYITLSRRANELSTEREVISASSQLVSLAEFPLRPSFPKPVPFIVGGFTLASVAGGLTALRRRKTDQPVDPTLLADLIDKLRITARIPLISLSPLLDRRPTLRTLLAQIEHPSPLQEAIRRVYAQIRLACLQEARRTLLITSSQAGEGKSMLTMGLATFAAKNGRRVLVIEGDLRRPAMAKTFGADPSTEGLSEYLAGTIADIPVHHAGAMLDVVYAGEPSYASTELLASDRLEALIRKISPKYDLVLIDSPPCDLLMDAEIIASQVDGIIYCVRYGAPDSQQVARNLAKLNANGGLLGLIVTSAPADEKSYYSIKRLT